MSRPIFHRLLSSLLGAALLAAPCPVRSQAPVRPDSQQEIDTTFELYSNAKTDPQRATAADYLQHLNRPAVATALIDHIIQARDGNQATAYNKLLEILKPEACDAVMQRLAQAQDPETKGKLIVALRHCPGDASVHALVVQMSDKRPVKFEARTATPRRVCDLAYDELYLKLRADPRFALDPTPRMAGLIREKTPVKTREELIARLTAKFPAPPAPSPSAAPLP